MFFQTSGKSTPLLSSIASIAAPEYLGPRSERWFAPRVKQRARIKSGHCARTYLLRRKNTPFLFLGFIFLSVKESTSHLRVADFAVLPTSLHELLMPTTADDGTVLDDQDEVAALDGADSLCYRDDGGVGEGTG